MTEKTAPPFSPLGAAARWPKLLLMAALVMAVISIVSGYLQVELISRAMSTGISEEEAAANDSRQQVIGIIQIALFLGTAVFFLIWFHRAHKNLESLRAHDIKYSPGWAVGGFFVPFLNLVRPFQVMREVWHGSDPGGLEGDASPERHLIEYRPGTPPLVGWWWALFLISGFLGNAVARLMLAPDMTIGRLQTLSYVQVFADFLDIPSALLAIRLVSRVTSRQSERAALVVGRQVQLPGDQ